MIYEPIVEIELIPRNQHNFTNVYWPIHHISFWDKGYRLVQEEKSTDMEAFDKNLS